MIEIVLTYVPVSCWIVYPYVYGFFYGPGQALFLPPNDVEAVGC